eukprot:CAMPEP_0185032642 /NCGR_PEP_ID=MMETSP1103-20130426/20883_1 /TAXON_ID=36769 /ORGANISM="Paraphysomonas bandaiensis, Strain Caron Lab Isolate" /LENGTH=664 /DNA_ID=CAMNT_0027568615 /DNA_START=114 /DNA_END=2105 /DNA_ORIENTATION=+
MNRRSRRVAESSTGPYTDVRAPGTSSKLSPYVMSQSKSHIQRERSLSKELPSYTSATRKSSPRSDAASSAIVTYRNAMLKSDKYMGNAGHDPLFPDLSQPLRSRASPQNMELISASGSSNAQDHVKISSVGLKNLGNTCFMNSALQCILHIEALVSYFRQGHYKADINRSAPLKGALATAFAELVEEMFSVSAGCAVAPLSFKKMVTKLAPHLLDYEQQDCQEFLRFLLDGMSEDLCRRTSQSSSQNSPGPATTLQPLSPCPPSDHSPGTPTQVHSPSPPVLSPPIHQDVDNGVTEHSIRPQFSGRTVERIRSIQSDTPTSALPPNRRSRVNVSRVGKSGNQHQHTPDKEFDVLSVNNRSHSGGNVSNDLEDVPGDVKLDKSKTIAGPSISSLPACTEDMATLRTLQQRARERRANQGQGTKKDDHQDMDVTENNPPMPRSPVSVVDQWDIAERESRLAWESYLKHNDSIITDIFGGQLQSSIECLTCHHRSLCFDPFLDLSVPIAQGAESEGRRSISSREPQKCSLQGCLDAFTAIEILDGDNAYNCEKCGVKRRSVKRLAIYKCPKILVIHIKRFRYTTFRREKMSTDVSFPVIGLDMSPYLSTEQKNALSSCNSPTDLSPVYDLASVAHHSGSMNGGHYIAHVDTRDTSVSCDSGTHPQNW